MSDPTASDWRDDLAAQLDQTFRGELAQRVAQMREALSRFEIGRAPLGGSQRADADVLDELTRHAHSIKGGAMLVGRDEIARLAGALEAYFPGQATANAASWRPAEVRAATDLMASLGKTERDTSTAGDPATAADVERLVDALGGGETRR